MGAAMSLLFNLRNLKVSCLGLTWSLDLGFKPETMRNDQAVIELRHFTTKCSPRNDE